ncbi:MAG TPA: DnaB-like helicase C-terminal domain-containing protein [Candidatus Azoamicus sp.]
MNKKGCNDKTKEVSDISRSLKIFAKKKGVLILALCQLNRNSDNRQDKTPQLSDLKNSGSLEQDADVVFY